MDGPSPDAPWAGVPAAVEAMVGVVGMGPEWFLTVSCGVAVSARVRVMVEGTRGGGCGMRSGAVWVRKAVGRALGRGLAAAVEGDTDGLGHDVAVAARWRALAWGGGAVW